MEQRLSLISLGVDDLKRSRAFYDALGWQISNSGEEAENIVAYNLHSMTFCLYPREKLAEELQLSPEGSGFRAIAIAYNARTKEDVDAVLKEAEAAGGKIVKQAQDVFWGGYSGYFSDPDGHLWEVAYNPFSPLGPNGEFQWGGAEE